MLVYSYDQFNTYHDYLEIIKYIVYFLISLCIIWTAIEYYFHRFILHPEIYENFPENNGKLYRESFNAHLKHHTFINQKHRIALPVPRLLLAIIIIYTVLKLIFSYGTAISLQSGSTIGVLLYDLLHYYFHFGGEPWFNYIAELKAAHMRHHYRHPDKEFGVSSRLWDIICGTDYKEKKEA